MRRVCVGELEEREGRDSRDKIGIMEREEGDNQGGGLVW
jgi:hypothetical protein